MDLSSPRSPAHATAPAAVGVAGALARGDVLALLPAYLVYLA